MRKSGSILLAICLCIVVTSCSLEIPTKNEETYPPDTLSIQSSTTENSEDNENQEQKVLLSPGEEIVAQSYISLEDVEFYYDGTDFFITNNREDIVMFAVEIVGVKADGSYEFIGIPAFYGVDEAEYEKDLAENGWAIKQTTNRVQPGESLKAELTIVDFGKDYPAWDIDGDGYYDMIFAIHPQKSETTTTVSSDYPKSAVYKLAVN